MNRKVWALFSIPPLFIGLYVMSGWIFKIPGWVNIENAFSPIYFNSALCFFLAGLGLLITTSNQIQLRHWQTVFGFLIFIVGLATFSEYLFHIDLNIDQFFVKDWRATNFDVYPGRMSLNSSAVFMGLGIILMAMPFAYNKAIGMLIDILMFGTFLIVTIALIGFVLNIEFLYSWSNSSRMTLAGAICLMSLIMGLWLIWRNAPASRTLYQGNEDYKIILLSSAILLTMAFVVTATIVASLIKQEIKMQTIRYQKMEKSYAEYFAREVNAVAKKPLLLKTNKLLSTAFLKSEPSSVAFQNLIQFLKADGFNAITVKKANKIIYQHGKMINSALLTVTKMQDGMKLNLFWDKGWHLRITQLFTEDNQNTELILQAPLLNINTVLTSDRAPGSTGDIGICSPHTPQNSICFYARDQLVRTAPLTVNGQYLSTFHALSKKSGAHIVYDYRFQKVLAAYGPIPGWGLGLLIKIKVEEIFAPIAQSVRTIFPVFLLTILVGLMLLRIQVLPLVRRVLNAEKELTRSNKRLKNSEERYALAVRGSNAGLWDWNIITDEVFYSPYFKGLLGYNETEFPNKLDSFYNILHPDDSKPLQIAVENHLINHAQFDMEYRLRRKSGDYHWFKAVGQALWDEEDNPLRMAGSITDITDRKRTESRLAAQYVVTKLLSEAQNLEEISKKILEELCKNLEWDAGAMWMVDSVAGVIRNTSFANKSLQDNDEFEAVSKMMEFQKGVGTPGRVWETGQPLWVYDVKSEKNFPRSPQAVASGFKSLFGFPILFQNRVLGSIEFYSREQNPPDEALLKMMSALTTQIGQFMQRKTAELSLKENENYKTAILESASDSILTVNEFGIIVSCNPKTNEIFGYPTNELLNKSVDMLVPNLSQTLKKQSGKLASEFVGINKNHEQFPVELSISKMFFGKQNVYACIVRDISERKKVDKLKNEFVSVVSHELRTPLTSIRGSLGLILGGTVGDYSAKARMLLEIANNNCNRLLLLINDILDIEKIEAGKMPFQLKKINVDKLLEEAYSNNRIYAERLEVKIHVSNYLPGVLIYADPDRLLQVMANLISNAAKFSPAGSEIVIAAEELTDTVKISIIDSGSGIPEKFRQNIFKRFSQADTSSTRGQGGTGLGLSITKAIIENLGGQIGFISEVGKGSNFYFEIPKFEKETKKEKPPEMIVSTGTLLICEDVVSSHKCKWLFCCMRFISLVKISFGDAYPKLLRGLLFN